jgi:DNA invertase Pin-like site-specific DNA recombinase
MFTTLDKNTNKHPPCSIRVAQYVRMSTEHQRYSTENQSRAIQEYAATHGMEIVRTYIDSGKSGLTSDGRRGFKELLLDIEKKAVNFAAILIYDISRWGRFQDTDESAHYEFLCKKAGIRLIFCAEGFENDGSSFSSIIKNLRRTMAGEYSKDLSKKVFIGQCHLIQLGFRQGGPSGFGLRRLLIDGQGISKGLLKRGEHKSLQTDRVILVPGPEAEIEIVQRIYHLFTAEKMTERRIADRFNQEGLTTDLGRSWTRGTVHQILTNEKYIGHNVFNRRSFKLKTQRIKNPSEQWIRKESAFQAIVSCELFQKVQSIISARSGHIDNTQMLEMLKSLWQRQGTLSGLIIDEQDDMPSSSAYRCRFGGLVKAYTLIGFRPDRDYQYLEINQTLRRLHPKVIAEICSGLQDVGAVVKVDTECGLLRVNNEWTLSVIIARCQTISEHRRRWRLRFDSSLTPDITVAVRMEDTNDNVLDYYLIPHIDIDIQPQKLADNHKCAVDIHRYDNLDYLYELASRIPLDRVA